MKFATLFVLVAAAVSPAMARKHKNQVALPVQAQDVPEFLRGHRQLNVIAEGGACAKTCTKPMGMWVCEPLGDPCDVDLRCDAATPSMGAEPQYPTGICVQAIGKLFIQ